MLIISNLKARSRYAFVGYGITATLIQGRRGRQLNGQGIIS